MLCQFQNGILERESTKQIVKQPVTTTSGRVRRSHAARRRKRARIAAEHRDLHCNLLQLPLYTQQLQPSMSLRSTSHPDFVVHRVSWRNTSLAFIGWGLAIVVEGAWGFGLKATRDFPANTPITQYEGRLLTKLEAKDIREGPQGQYIASHFATTAHNGVVINGYSVAPTVGGYRVTVEDMFGKGGASFVNHCNTPNARMVRDRTKSEGDGHGVFIVSNCAIKSGKFIHVHYGKSFVHSKISNLC